MNEEIKKMLTELLDSMKSLEGRITRIEQKGTESICAPGDGVQTTLAIAYYLETYGSVSPFNKNDLEQGFRSAKETVPQNINDKTSMCIKNGHMMEAETKKDNMKAWVITRSGEQYVQKGFKKE